MYLSSSYGNRRSPVSYTHLDVYKRQPKENRSQQPKENRPPREGRPKQPREPKENKAQQPREENGLSLIHIFLSPQAFGVNSIALGDNSKAYGANSKGLRR